MTDQMQTNETPKGDQIEAYIGDATSDVIISKDIISAGDRGVAAKQIYESNVVTGDHNQIIIQRLDPSDARNQRNHKMLRQMVRSFWVDGVLKSSLYNEVLIRLNLEEKPNAIDNRPWDLILKQRGEPDYSIPAGTPIIDIFDRMNQLLLILGEPGSGKTTTLLELADELLTRADFDTTHPTPVVFNLSSWTKQKQPLVTWVLNELQDKYCVPSKVAQWWIENDELLLLLDGLDEVQSSYRGSCIETINEFRKEHLIPIALCSRTTEYAALITRLKVQGAIQIRTLTFEQIDNYVKSLNILPAINALIQQNKDVQDILQSPLMLNILVMTLQENSNTLLLPDNESPLQNQQLFNAYIKRMLMFRATEPFMPIVNILQLLKWLATHERKQSESMLLLNDIISSLLTKSATAAWLAIYFLINALIVGLYCGLISFPFDFRKGLYAGSILGFLIALTSVVGNRISALIVPSSLWTNLRSVMCSALFWGIACWGGALLVSYASSDISASLLIPVGYMAGAIVGRFREIRFTHYPAVTWNTLKRNVLSGMMFGVVVGLTVGVLMIALTSVFGNLQTTLYLGLFMLILGIIAGPFVGILFGLIFEPSQTLKIPINLGEDKITQRRKIVRYYLPIAGALFAGTIGVITGITYHIIIGVLSAVIAYMIFVLLYSIDGFKMYTIFLVIKWNYGTPLNFNRFLDYSAKYNFLRKVGINYIFIHRMLMEHFANMTNEDIERIAREVEMGR